ncbi:MAG: CARDB domain-containing protein [Candidatus Pacebacteria bacterium]|nr:CARDB domain-containing protein [Candidatus Paceibacterota bacterium]
MSDTPDTNEPNPDLGQNFHEEPPKKSEVKEFAKKGFLIGVIVIFIIVGSYAVIKIAPSIFSSLASVSVSVSSIFKPKGVPPTTSTSPTPKTTPIVIVTTPAPTPTPSPVTSYTSPTPAPIVTYNQYNQNGKADLVLHVLSTGVIDRNANVFTARSSMDASERAAVRFEVVNSGDKASGGWNFTMLMPVSLGKDVYASPTERSLAPGERMEFTVGFDNILTGRQPVTISVDEGGLVSESNKNNNAGTVYFNVTGNSVYGNTNTYYPPTNGYYGGGLPDLTIRAIGVGVLDPYTGAFTPTGQILSNQRVAVQFEVSNIGGGATGPWTFSANLPSYTDSFYSSGYEPSLAPGDRIVLTIGFDNITSNNSYNYNYSSYPTYYPSANYNAPVTITLDQNNRIRELNENNNSLHISIPVVY